MSTWTAEDVERQNAKVGATMPAHVKPSSAKVSKAHKYRAEPCIVTDDLTLFTRAEIYTAEAAKHHPLTGTGTLKERAARAEIFGQWFGSTKEGKRYIELTKLENAGLIRNLRRQVPYGLEVFVVDPSECVTLGEWRADFVFENRLPTENMAREKWYTVVEDCKGVKTDLYRWKKKHVEAQYGFTITET